MNKIVFEHYPVSKLPEDLREGMDISSTARVVIEPLDVAGENDQQKWPGFANLPDIEREPMTIEQVRLLIERMKAEGRPSVSAEEAVAIIRELRDEWDY